MESKEHVIIINHNNNDEIDEKNWDWIKSMESNKDRIWLTINQYPPFVITIPKSKLKPEEIDFFDLVAIDKFS